MKDLFPGYYQPSEQEFKYLWEQCIFSFDANILLHIYRFTPSTRERFLELIDKLKDRIWITYQAAYEFQKNRLNVISTQQEAYQGIVGILDQAVIKIENELGSYKKHPYIDRKRIISTLKDSINQIKEKLECDSQQHPNLLKFDELRESLDKLLIDRIGEGIPPNELKRIYQQGSERFKAEIPPGFKNDKKKEPDKYGDFVVWRQLIEYSKKHQKPVVFVTDEAGEDWWLKDKKGKIISPRPELIHEFLEETGQKFYIYSSDKFIEYAAQFLALSPKQEAIDEARQIRLDSGSSTPQKETTDNFKVVSIDNQSNIQCSRCSSNATIIVNEGVAAGQFSRIWLLVCSNCGLQKVLQYESLEP